MRVEQQEGLGNKILLLFSLSHFASPDIAMAKVQDLLDKHGVSDVEVNAHRDRTKGIEVQVAVSKSDLHKVKPVVVKVARDLHTNLESVTNRILGRVCEDVVPMDWHKKKVRNPATGNMVQVGSLAPEEQEKYRPKKHKDAERSNAVQDRISSFVKDTAKDLGISDWEYVDKKLVNKKTGEKLKIKGGTFQSLHRQLIDLSKNK